MSDIAFAAILLGLFCGLPLIAVLAIWVEREQNRKDHLAGIHRPAARHEGGE